MTIYFLSGLGADSRVFKYLSLPDSFKLVFIDWIVPEENEAFSQYAQRISKRINTSEQFVLVGLSFGGILATEVMQFVNPQKVILISSVTRKQELPFYYRLAGILKLNKFIPTKAVNKSNFLIQWLFGITEKKDKELLNDILTSTNTKFSKWAVSQIVNWNRHVSPPNIVRIHGDKDRVLPIINFIPDYTISHAGHFMIVKNADEISKILISEITSTIF